MGYISVSDVNKIIKKDIESDVFLKNIQVIGEVSNYKGHNSGHMYFSLKDDESKINCVMFQSYASRVNFKLEDGMKVVVTCSVGAYITSGSYQLYVYNIDPIGVGGLYLQFEELKKKLQLEGLFDEEHKRSIPKYPLNIGVISAKEGAAIQDVITTIRRRWPIAKLTLHPSLVQGAYAADDIVKNLIEADKKDYDLIIVARGGGSIEDLWCFNEEIVARTVYDMKTPIISAVGHEVDFTIIDFVSSLRAPTPTAAAELATPNILDVTNDIGNYKQRLINSIKQIIDKNKLVIENYKNNPYLTKIENIFADRYQKINLLQQRLINIRSNIINNTSHKIEITKNELIDSFNNVKLNLTNNIKKVEAKLDALSPLKVMTRGYGIIEKDNAVITSVDKVKLGDNLNIKLNDGTINASVIDIKRRK